jgi:Raf kinase inhibitor-like YbhB/YbcL family protein
MPLQLKSASFDAAAPIPKRHTCDGDDVSPALSWTGVPAGAKSLALIEDDPDAPDPAAPKVVWVHWVLYNIPVSAASLPEGATAKTLPQGTREGLNDWKKTGYRGPCPPVGEHRYVHKLYALDVVLPDLGRVTKTALEKVMEGHVLGKAELVGTYRRR